MEQQAITNQDRTETLVKEKVVTIWNHFTSCSNWSNGSFISFHFGNLGPLTHGTYIFVGPTCQPVSHREAQLLLLGSWYSELPIAIEASWARWKDAADSIQVDGNQIRGRKIDELSRSVLLSTVNRGDEKRRSNLQPKEYAEPRGRREISTAKLPYAQRRDWGKNRRSQKSTAPKIPRGGARAHATPVRARGRKRGEGDRYLGEKLLRVELRVGEGAGARAGAPRQRRALLLLLPPRRVPHRRRPLERASATTPASAERAPLPQHQRRRRRQRLLVDGHRLGASAAAAAARRHGWPPLRHRRRRRRRCLPGDAGHQRPHLALAGDLAAGFCSSESESEKAQEREMARQKWQEKHTKIYTSGGYYSLLQKGPHLLTKLEFQLLVVSVDRWQKKRISPSCENVARWLRRSSESTIKKTQEIF